MGDLPQAGGDPRQTGSFAIPYVGMLLLGLVGAAIAYLMLRWLDPRAARLELAKTALAVVAGSGAGAALYVSYRKQRTDEGNSVREQDKLFTDRYTKAVEQLGHSVAAIRLGGVTALARIADDSERDRPTCLKLLCSYLRMPYESDDDQERHVRLAVQSELSARLLPGRPGFWVDADLNLTRAHLSEFSLARRVVRNADFSDAVFDGKADFSGANFTVSATFDRAVFAGFANFARATVSRTELLPYGIIGGSFVGTDFSGPTDFEGATFVGMAQFKDSVFNGIAVFSRVKFLGRASFEGVEFKPRTESMDGGRARFVEAKFADRTSFSGASFGVHAEFVRASFDGYVEFHRSAFEMGVSFVSAKFESDAVFTKAEFGQGTNFDDAVFSRPLVGDPNRHYGEWKYLDGSLDELTSVTPFVQGSPMGHPRHVSRINNLLLKPAEELTHIEMATILSIRVGVGDYIPAALALLEADPFEEANIFGLLFLTILKVEPSYWEREDESLARLHSLAVRVAGLGAFSSAQPPFDEIACLLDRLPPQ